MTEDEQKWNRNPSIRCRLAGLHYLAVSIKTFTLSKLKDRIICTQNLYFQHSFPTKMSVPASEQTKPHKQHRHLMFFSGCNKADAAS